MISCTKWTKQSTPERMYPVTLRLVATSYATFKGFPLMTKKMTKKTVESPMRYKTSLRMQLFPASMGGPMTRSNTQTSPSMSIPGRRYSPSIVARSPATDLEPYLILTPPAVRRIRQSARLKTPTLATTRYACRTHCHVPTPQVVTTPRTNPRMVVATATPTSIAI